MSIAYQKEIFLHLITQEYKGEFNTIKNNLNLLIAVNQ
jgi:hypothetical protein